MHIFKNSNNSIIELTKVKMFGSYYVKIKQSFSDEKKIMNMTKKPQEIAYSIKL